LIFLKAMMMVDGFPSCPPGIKNDSNEQDNTMAHKACQMDRKEMQLHDVKRRKKSKGFHESKNRKSTSMHLTQNDVLTMKSSGALFDLDHWPGNQRGQSGS